MNTAMSSTSPLELPALSAPSTGSPLRQASDAAAWAPSSGVGSPFALDSVISGLQSSLDQLALRLDAENDALWCSFVHPERPCFTPDLLGDITRFQRRLEKALRMPSLLGQAPLGALVWRSGFPDVWNLGGDLELFVQLIRSGDRTGLRTYAHACVETVYRNWTKGGARLQTIALVQGDALGGGFEAALSNDVIIAERHSKFGLPEILFRMFPGMGAYSFLSRRIGAAGAEAMITSGRLYSASEMADLGIVDLVVETGEGEAAVADWLSRQRRRRRVMDALASVRRRCQPITHEELIDVTDIWVETALALEASDLRKMERLAKAQDRRRARDAVRAAA